MRKLSTKFPRKSTKAWGILGLYILIYDVIAIVLNLKNEAQDNPDRYETLSDACWQAVKHPKRRWMVWGGMLVLVKHLAMPEFLKKLDPIGLVALIVKGIFAVRYVRLLRN